MFKSLVVAAIVALIAAWQAARFRRRMQGPIASDRCISCDSNDLEVLGANAYRCRSCGYEGGEGLGAMLEARAMAAYAGLEPEERQRIARQRLRDAMRTLMGVSERASGDPDEVMQWVTSVDGVALQAASELDEARRASGGGIHLAGHGTLDPGAFASQLRATTSSVENPFERQPGGRNARRTLRIIADVRAQLEHALREVPEERPRGKASGSGYRR